MTSITGYRADNKRFLKKIIFSCNEKKGKEEKERKMAGGKKAGGDQKKVQKIVEDKTFGLKNKNKSKKVQNYVKTVEQQAANAGERKENLMMKKMRENEMWRKGKDPSVNFIMVWKCWSGGVDGVFFQEKRK
jgi:hypothetical protein